jgi:hypothetical protein
MDRHSPSGEWSRQGRLLVDKHPSCGGWSRLKDCWWTDIFPEFTVVVGGKMVNDSHSSRTYVQIRRIILVAHGVASSICWNSYSSRTYVRIRRMVLVSLCGVSDLFNIMPDYSDGVWLREMMQLMLSDDIDSDDVARELIYVIMR